MKLCKIVIISLFYVLMVGCEENGQRSSEMRLINTKLVTSINDIALENAIITQHTLFPYHFVKNSAELNELGQHDLAILAKHFMEHAGQLNIRRNNIPADLYEARINLVLDMLKKAGIDKEQISISDGMPGGSGMASERILTILESTTTSTPVQTTTTQSIRSRR